ncbi:nitrogen regulation protein NR(I) [Lysobacter sp. HDW10]|uniref:nitrogen regulation protein NR(I) n=1 Tax=Lysobacter sp. HDW10 TaxID=2714936 RepID=UPI00140AD1CF|nr:nitrogen regulation protein NR(I) [Lysobacter sp. HDW10]QIK80706.1 nitrogen regulation protein NR(I) [Lysobacter sp. HDW10]
MAMTNESSIWVVDDDPAVRFVLSTALSDAGYAVASFAHIAAVEEALASGRAPRVLLTDVRMPGEDGLSFLARFKATHTDTPVIVVSAFTDVKSTASAFRNGAYDFISKPFDLDDAVQVVARAFGTIDQAPVIDTPPALEIPQLIGQAPSMQALFRTLGRAAQTPMSVLITGETGTGKELIARALHLESRRAAAPFIALNTAAIPTELLESELFGHEAGAFTGAQKRHLGRFEQANGGTLFLDEIGDMPAALQTRLLRVLAEGEFFRVGGRELIGVDVRIIAATHQPLERLVSEGRFRADLLHRLDVIRVVVPPLRARKEDLPDLANAFLAACAHKMGVRKKHFDRGALKLLRAYDWPGNVRELENLCWRVTALSAAEKIGAREVEAVMQGPREAADSAWESALSEWAADALASGASAPYTHAKARMDDILMREALKVTRGHRGDAAQRLGVGRNTLTRKLGSSRDKTSSD